ncbi:hypothetical protein [Chroococcidiopsis sp.]|uniref:hypothetical protein n=1 Tax=Chroococcidiopsis sp. TaxID=3088168 RepID=UPI003F34377F
MDIDRLRKLAEAGWAVGDATDFLECSPEDIGITIEDVLYPPGVQIQSDGNTVWVHQGGETIARFGARGIDIHNTVKDVIDGKRECLFCAHGPTNREDWVTFIVKTYETFGVVIGWKHTPKRFLKEDEIMNNFVTLQTMLAGDASAFYLQRFMEDIE